MKANKGFTRYRNKKIVELRDEYGLTFSDIARRFRMSTNGVWKVYMREKGLRGRNKKCSNEQ